MGIRHVLLCASSLIVGCMGAELSEEEYLRRQQSENLCLNLQEQAEAGNKMASYALANYHYFGNQFIDDPEKMKSSYYKADDGKTRIYYRLNNVEVKPEDYEKAFKLYEQAALHEHWFSLWSLGECYELGRGTDQDLVKAAECYRKASKAGCSFAQRSLGLMYLDGSGGLPRSESEALKLFREAANNGLASAQYNLGMMYVLGKGTRRNETEAVKWLQKAADQGDARAWSNLGEMHQDGRGGLKKNEQKALECYSKACDQGYEKIRPRFNELKKKFQVQNRISKIEVPKNFQQGDMDPESQFEMGKKYSLGTGTRQNSFEAAKWFRKAAERGHADAQNNLGMSYLEGIGVRRDASEALKWFKKSAEQEFSDAQNNLGFLYCQGRGVRQSYSKGAKWFRKAAEQGDADAQATLGALYKDGNGVPQSDQEAAKWFRMSAEQGNPKAQETLGMMYFMGKGVPKDHLKAVEWLHKAADQGCSEAQELLVDLRMGQSLRFFDPFELQPKKSKSKNNARKNIASEEEYLSLPKNAFGPHKKLWEFARKGDSSAQTRLGLMYMAGQDGCPQDYEEAATSKITSKFLL